jgi:bifunctional DNase/RNase
MVDLELLGVRLELPSNTPVVLLREETGERRNLPIYIGPEEAKAIAMVLEGVTTPRPMTHDLFRDVLQATGHQLVSVTITELRTGPGGKGGTFYAELELTGPAGTVRVSSRPSDAIALAVRTGSPIRASEEVLAEAGTPSVEEEEAEPVEQEEIVGEFRAFLDEVNPEDFAS